MPKLKTNKAIAKRIRITKTGKLLHRTGGQDRYNAKEKSKITTNKRRDRKITKADKKNIKKLIPYS